MSHAPATVKPAPAPPWLAVTTDPLKAMAISAVADRTEAYRADDGSTVTVGVFDGSIRSAAALAELLAASGQRIPRDRRALADGHAVYLLDREQPPLSVGVLIEAVIHGA
ncbi:MAG TPA: hypothetical protein VGE74_01660 [Gemmata sp.]